MPKKVNAEIASYRACFMSDPGQRVLGDLLIQAGYFDTDLQTEGEVAVQNFAKLIIKKMGIRAYNGPEGVQEYVSKLIELKGI